MLTFSNWIEWNEIDMFEGCELTIKPAPSSLYFDWVIIGLKVALCCKTVKVIFLDKGISLSI